MRTTRVVLAAVLTLAVATYFGIHAAVVSNLSVDVTSWLEARCHFRSAHVALQITMDSRVCGSPAIDGYAHVDIECLRRSPTALWWLRARPTEEELVTHIERRADYDGNDARGIVLPISLSLARNVC
jgi:hypothetical protein